MRTRARLAVVMTVAGVAALLGVVMALPGVADPLPGGLGPCLGSACPDDWSDPHTGGAAGYDEAINVYVGGNYQVRDKAAEAEGKIVVLGDFDQNKASGSGGLYNVGIVGVGSQVQPPPGSDFLTVGGNITIASGQTLEAAGGKVRYAGTASGTINADEKVQDPKAVEPYTDLRLQLEEASQCYADTTNVPATGTVAYPSNQTGPVVTFTGDGTSALQVFYVDKDVQTASGGAVDIQFAGIPAGATVLINVTKPDWTIKATGSNPDTWTPIRQNLLWNLPNATTPTFGGTAQFMGSVLVGAPASTTSVVVPGMNGRFFTTGNVIHGGPGGGTGNEFHSYPFDGDLPSCAAPIPTTGSPSSSSPTASPTASPTESPTPSPTVSPTESPTPSPTPSPTESPTASPTASPTVSPTESPTASPTTSPSSSGPVPTTPTTTPSSQGPVPTTPTTGPVLPTTGVKLWIGIMSALGLSLVGIGVLAMIRQRREE